MKFNIKTKLLIFIITIVMIFSSLPPTIVAEDSNAKIENRQGSYFLITPHITVKLSEGKPDLMFWMTDSNQKQKRIPVFHVGFSHIVELFGDDLIVDSRDELMGGKSYNLAALDWTLTNETFENELRAYLTSETLSDGADISFVFHIYTEDVTITQKLNETTVTYESKAISEIKFDIIINNWSFSENATGVTVLTNIHELAYRNRVRAGERVNNAEGDSYNNQTHESREKREHDPEKWGVEFTDNRNRIQSYFAWIPEADVFDLEDNYIETVNATASILSQGLKEVHANDKKFNVDYVHLFLSYPNYGDSLKLVHDPLVGLGDTGGISWDFIVLTSIPILVIGLIVINRKRR